MLTGAIDRVFPIVSVDSATQLTLSVLYDGLFPDGGDPAPTPVGTASGLTFVDPHVLAAAADRQRAAPRRRDWIRRTRRGRHDPQPRVASSVPARWARCR